jgi:RNA polymerase sigma factor (sigma-70 family)
VTGTQDQRRQRFDALFAAYGPDIVAYCGWRADLESDAQDAVAEVFLTAWRRLDELPEGDAARVWLYATARRVLANQHRSARRREALRERMAREPAPAATEPSAAAGEEALVRAALMQLGPRDREVLLLAEWEDLAPAQIAEVLGCLAVTARGRLHRARRRFRHAFEALRAANDEVPTHDHDGFLRGEHQHV